MHRPRDLFYPVINIFSAVLDNKYLLRDIYYPKQHRFS